MDDLGAIASGVQEGQTAEERVQALQQSFDRFMQESTKLELSYRSLVEKKDRALQAKVEELDAAARYLDSILRNMAQGMLFVATSGIVTAYNLSCEKILNKEKTDVLGKHFSAVFSDTLFGFSLSQALQTGTAPEKCEVSFQGERWVEVCCTFTARPEESAKGLLILLRDVTKERCLQKIAGRNDRMKELGEMAASVAHEIRNPLGGIKGFASLLCRDLQDRPDLALMAKQMVEGCTILEKLVEEVLAYSRPVHLQPEVIDLSCLLQDIAQMVEVDPAFGKDFHLQMEGESVRVCLDCHSVKRALLNLIINAAQSMEYKEKAKLLWKKEGERVRICLVDQGSGIPKENLEKIFSPFFTTKAQGNGFGLSEVYKIVQAHGGSIAVDSEVGVGTTFTIDLPITPHL